MPPKKQAHLSSFIFRDKKLEESKLFTKKEGEDGVDEDSMNFDVLVHNPKRDLLKSDKRNVISDENLMKIRLNSWFNLINALFHFSLIFVYFFLGRDQNLNVGGGFLYLTHGPVAGYDIPNERFDNTLSFLGIQVWEFRNVNFIGIISIIFTIICGLEAILSFAKSTWKYYFYELIARGCNPFLHILICFTMSWLSMDIFLSLGQRDVLFNTINFGLVFAIFYYWFTFQKNNRWETDKMFAYINKDSTGKNVYPTGEYIEGSMLDFTEIDWSPAIAALLFWAIQFSIFVSTYAFSENKAIWQVASCFAIYTVMQLLVVLCMLLYAFKVTYLKDYMYFNTTVHMILSIGTTIILMFTAIPVWVNHTQIA